MKKIIRSSSIADKEALNSMKKIYSKAKDLLNAIEDAPEGTIEELDINDLYEVLIEDIPAVAYAIKTSNNKNVNVNEDMW